MLDDVAVAVRTRRLWIDGLGPWLADQGHDLGDVWETTTLRRRGLILDLLTPINFGEGDPFADGVGQEMEARLADATQGAMRRVRWRYAGASPKPPRRAKSTDRDIFEGGDLTGDHLAATAAQLARTLQPNATAEFTGTLGQVAVAALSRHRMWLVVADAARAEGIRTTPGAAYVIHDTVRRLQKSDPLYTIYVDPLLAARSPGLASSKTVDMTA